MDAERVGASVEGEGDHHNVLTELIDLAHSIIITMTSAIKKALMRFGLTEPEARVYVAALELGSASVQDLAHRIRGNRVTVHGLVQSLIRKGFVYEERTGKTRRLVPASPNKLIDLLTVEEQKMKRKREEADWLIPSLKAHTNLSTPETKITYYEGLEGMKSFVSQVFECEGEMLEWTKIENFSSVFSDYLENVYFPQKRALQIPTRFILIDTPEAHAYIEKNYVHQKDAPPMKARFIDQKQFDMPGYIVIWNDKYSINVPAELKAVVIQDALIADTQRQIFEYAWIHATGETQNKPYPRQKR